MTQATITKAFYIILKICTSIRGVSEFEYTDIISSYVIFIAFLWTWK